MTICETISARVRASVIALVAMLMIAVVVAPLPAVAQTTAPSPTVDVQTEAQGSSNDSQMWEAIRRGATGNVSIPDKNSATLIQSEGEVWRDIRNGPLSLYSAAALFGIVFLLGLFFVVRGRVRIEHGKAGYTILRFTGIERFAHWLMAGSFIILALTGLNMLFGRHVLLPVIGKEAFAFITQWGKYLHNYLAFAFMAGVLLAFFLWVAHNLPSRTDLNWVLKGGGLLSRNSHPPAKKFNFGQKIIFWSVTILTISVSLSGIALMFPFETAFMAKTFAFLNIFGFDLPTALAPIQEQQLNQVWHTIVGVLFIVIILAHIYIGSVGMEGAFDAMGSGQVDANWAREHHSLWVEKLEQEGKLKQVRQPAE